MDNKDLILVCQLNPTPAQAQKIESTLQAFSDACNYINQVVDPKITHNVTIQNIVYQDIREKFDLPSNLAIRAINRVSGNRKAAKKQGTSVNKFKPTSADYDARIFSFREKDWTVSLTTVNGRERFRLDVGSYQKGKLTGSHPISAKLTKRQNGTYTINIKLNHSHQHHDAKSSA